MLVTLTRDADPTRVRASLQGMGLWTEPLASSTGDTRALWIAEHSSQVPAERIAGVEGVAEVCSRPSAHPLVDALAGRAADVGPTAIGQSATPVLMAGPCSVESPEQIQRAAQAVSQSGGRLLRGGAFKPRTSPYSFPGVGREALSWMVAAARAHDLGVVTEVMSEHDVDAVADAADMMQVGSRNMQNFALLRAVGGAHKPVLLKRGMAATVEEWLHAGEHLMAAGAPSVVFCERGIQGFDPLTRNLLDLGAVALLSQTMGLPVVVDPSHAAGRRDLVVALSRAALAAGAHGLLVEFHPDPGHARSDGPQALTSDELARLQRECFA